MRIAAFVEQGLLAVLKSRPGVATIDNARIPQIGKRATKHLQNSDPYDHVVRYEHDAFAILSACMFSQLRSKCAPPSEHIGDPVFDEIFHPIARRLLGRCDAVLRVGGASAGADEMVAIARGAGKPVFTAIDELP